MADVKKTVIIDLKAIGNIDKYLDTLVVKFTGLSKDIDKVVKPIANLVNTLSGAKIPDGVVKTIEAIKGLNGIKIPPVDSLAKGLEKLSGMTFSGLNFGSLATELKKLTGIKVPALNQLADGLKKLADGTLNMNQVAANIKALIAPLTRLAGIDLPNIPGIATALTKLSKTTFNAGASQNIQLFVDAIKKLDGIKPPSVTNFAKGFNELITILSKPLPDFQKFADEIRKLSGLKLPSIAQFAQGFKSIEKLNIQAISQKIVELSNAIGLLEKAGKLKAFATFAQDLRGLSAQLTAANGPLQQLQSTLQQYGNAADTAGKKTKGFGERLQNYIQYRMIADTVMQLQNAFTGTIDVLKQYDQALKDLQAITGATDVEVGMMGDTIKKVAVEAKFSLTEIAEGMRTFGQAGFSAAETMKSIQAVSDLATGTLSDMAMTVDLVSTAMKVFDIAAENSAHVADVFANAVNKSKLNIDKIRTAFNYVGPVATEAGITFEETAASMMVLANSGQRASTIGTGLRRLFSDLTDPSEKFAAAVDKAGMTMDQLDPRVNSLSSVLKNLDVVVTDAGMAFDIFGKWGANSVLALKDMDNGFEDMLVAVGQSGAAAEMAAIQVTGLDVVFKNLKDRIEVLALSFGEAGLNTLLRVFASTVGVVVDVLTALNSTALGGFILKSALVLAAVSVLVAIYGKLTLAVNVVTAAYKSQLVAGAYLIATQAKMGTSLISVGTSFKGFSTWLRNARVAIMAFAGASTIMSGIVTSLAFPVAVLAAQFIYAIKQINKFKESSKEAAREAIEFGSLGDSMKAYSDNVRNLSEDSNELKEANMALRKELLKTIEANDDLSASAIAAASSIDPFTGKILDNGKALKIYNDEISRLQMTKLVQSYSDAVDNMESQSGKMNRFLNFNLTNIKSWGTALSGYASSMIDVMDGNFSEIPKSLSKAFNKSADEIRQNKISDAFATSLEAGTVSFEKFGEYIKDVTKNGVKGLTDQNKDLYESYQLLNQSSSAFIAELMKTGQITLDTPISELEKIAENAGISGVKMDALLSKFSSLAGIKLTKTSTGQDLVAEFSDGIGKIEEYIETYKAFGETITDVELKNILSIENSKKALAEQFKLIESGFQERKKQGMDDAKNGEIDYLAKEKWMVAYRKLLKQGTEDFKYSSIQKMKAADDEYNARLKSNEKFGKESIARGREDAKAQIDFEKAKADAMLAVYDPAKLQEMLKSRVAVLEANNQEELHRIALLEASGVDSAEEADKKRFQSTLRMLDDKFKAYEKTENAIRAATGDNTEEIKAAENVRMGAAEERSKFIQEQIVKQVEAERKAKDAIDKLDKDRLKENKGYAEKIEKVEDTLNDNLKSAKLTYYDKIGDLEDKRLEKFKEINEKILEDEQKTQESIADIKASGDDKINAIKQKGMSDTQKDWDNRTRAEAKLAEGIALVEKAGTNKDRAALERGRKLIEQAQSMGEGFRREYAAIDMIKDTTEALVKAQETEGVLNKLDKEKEKEEAVADAIRGKKEALEDYEKRRAELLDTYQEAIAAENIRHNDTIRNLDDELTKWEKILAVAISIKSLSTSAPGDLTPLPSKSVSANENVTGAAYGTGGGASLHPEKIAQEGEAIKKTGDEIAASFEKSFKTASDGVKESVVQSGTAIEDVSNKSTSTLEGTAEKVWRELYVNGTQVFSDLTDEQMSSFNKLGESISDVGRKTETVFSEASVDTDGLDKAKEKVKGVSDEMVASSADSSEKMSANISEGYRKVTKEGETFYTNMSDAQLDMFAKVGDAMVSSGEKVNSTFNEDNVDTSGITKIKDSVDEVLTVSSEGVDLVITTSMAETDVAQIKKNVDDLGDTKAEPEVVVKPEGTEKVTYLKRLIDEIEDKYFRVQANTENSIMKLDLVLTRIEEIFKYDGQKVKVTVQTDYVSTGDKPKGGTTSFSGSEPTKYALGGSVSRMFKKLADRFISSGSGNGDDVPAMLKKGEFVQTDSAVDYYGKPFMRAINARKIPRNLIPRFNMGGLVGGIESFVQAFSKGGSVLGSALGSVKKKFEYLLGNEKSDSIGQVNLNVNQIIKDAETKSNSPLAVSGIASLRDAFNASVSNFAAGGTTSAAEIEAARKKLMSQYNQQIRKASQSGDAEVKKILEREKMEMMELSYKLTSTLETLKTEYNKYVAEKTLEYDTTVAEIKSSYAYDSTENKTKHDEKLKELNDKYAEDLENIAKDMTSDTTDFSEKIEDYKRKRDELTAEFEDDRVSNAAEHSSLKSEANLLGTKISSILGQYRVQKSKSERTQRDNLSSRGYGPGNAAPFGGRSHAGSFTLDEFDEYERQKSGPYSIRGNAEPDFNQIREMVYEMFPELRDSEGTGELRKVFAGGAGTSMEDGRTTSSSRYLDTNAALELIKQAVDIEKSIREISPEVLKNEFDLEMAEITRDNEKDTADHNEKQLENTEKKTSVVSVYDKNILDENTDYSKNEAERALKYSTSLLERQTDFEKDMVNRKLAYETNVKDAKEQYSKDSLSIAERTATDALAAIKSVEKTATAATTAVSTKTATVSDIADATSGVLKSTAATSFFKNLGMSTSVFTSSLDDFFKRLGMSARRYNIGGFVSPTADSVSGKDSIFSMLTPKEYVIPEHIVEFFGKGFFDDLLTRRLPGFNLGGMVSRMPETSFSNASQLVQHSLDLNINGSNHGPFYAEPNTINEFLNDMFVAKMRV